MPDATSRTVPTRLRERSGTDRALVAAILDEALVAHVAFVVDGEPRVLPTLHVRRGDTLYLHGSTASTPMRLARADGLDVCVTVTLLDGLVFARSGFHHSVAYRSVVAHGRARPVTDAVEKQQVLDALLDHVAAGRSADCRPPTRAESAATAVLALPLTEASTKHGSGLVEGSTDEDPEDTALPHWAGVLPLSLVAGVPRASADLGPVPLPPYLVGYARRRDTPGFAASAWHAAPTLVGDLVRLEALGPQHVEGLFDASRDPEVFRWLSIRAPRTRDDVAADVTAALRAADAGERVPFAQVERASGRVVGTTSYYEVRPERAQLAIGHTWLGSPWWRTGLNTEAKLLLLGRAFDDLGALRVAWHTDLRNTRSQAAIARLGAVREGVLRQDRIRPDGSLRDTVAYGMTDAEWPAVRDRLRTWLARGDGPAGDTGR